MTEANIPAMLNAAHAFRTMTDHLIEGGMDADQVLTALLTTGVERVARTRGACGAAHWLRRMASHIDTHGDAVEFMANAPDEAKGH